MNIFYTGDNLSVSSTSNGIQYFSFLTTLLPLHFNDTSLAHFFTPTSSTTLETRFHGYLHGKIILRSPSNDQKSQHEIPFVEIISFRLGKQILANSRAGEQ